jgi:hypothetical protein
MNTRYSITIIFTALLLYTTAAYSQLAKPTLSAENVGWGWFDLKMTENSITPSSTHWVITNDDGSFTLFDSWRNRTACDSEVFAGRIPNDFIADTRDLTSKKIIGCPDNRTFIAKVRYTDGTQWSPFSEPITITTLPEPVRTDDTVYVLLYGHSLMAWNSLCGMSMGDGLLLSETDGYQSPNYGNSFGHALQTELRRTTGRTVTLINYAVNGSRQSRWMRSGIGSDTAIDHTQWDSYQNYIRFYRAGNQPEDGQFLDTGKYRIAAFFFGQNDARAPYPVEKYVEDATGIINELTGKGVKVVYNSIHYATAQQTEEPYHWYAAQYDQQLRYYNAWDSLMTALVPVNKRLWRGLDFYSLFKSDTERYWFPDNIHTNLSEGVPGIVVPLAKIIRDAIENTTASATTGASRLEESSLTVSPNPSAAALTFQVSNASAGRVTVEIVDILGRNVQTIFDDTMERGEHRLKLNAGTLQPGTYLCRLRTESGVTARKFQVVQ